MAHAALISLKQILEQILKPDCQPLIPHDKQQIESLLEKVGSLQDLLENSSPNSSNERANLESQIRDAAYKAEDIIESYIMDQGPSESRSHTDNFNDFCRGLEEARKKETESKKKGLMRTDAGSGTQSSQPRISLLADRTRLSWRGKNTLVGLDDDLTKVKTWLIRDSLKLETISIVGKGGIGKTTLAREVCQDPFILNCFRTRACIKLSQNYDVRRILSGLLLSMKKLTDEMCRWSDEQLAEYLYSSLKDTRYLLVMDGVWDAKIWDDVKRSFPDDGTGSRVLLTTRLNNMAVYGDSCHLIHQMHVLNEDDSWNLLRAKVFGGDCFPPELEEIGIKIAQTCHGLPGAIVEMGNLLLKVDKTQDCWQNVLKQVKSSVLEQIIHQDYPHMSPLHKRLIRSHAESLGVLQDSSQKNSKEMSSLESHIRNGVSKAKDIIESHITDQGPSQSTKGDKFIIFRQDLEEVMKEMDSKKRLMRIEDRSGLEQRNSLPAGRIKLTWSGKNSLVGLDDDLIEIKTRLSRRSLKLETISIVGMGGIGKTTLARKVYDDPFIPHHFHLHTWITVSPNYHVRETLLGLLESMEKLADEMRQWSGEQLAEYLYKSLKGSRYLIVMDDLWDAEILHDMKRLFPDDRNGSRIMLTTRIENVAIDANSCLPLHRMHFLSEEKSWNLLREKVFGEDCCPPELEKIGIKIAQNCQGLPLAIVVIGGILSKAEKTEEYWQTVVNSTGSTDDEKCLEILSLSYTHLPHHLKACFLYMGIFPEDANISVSTLFKLWVAEGFLKPSGSKSLEAVAEEYLLDLVDRSLILVHKYRSNGKIRTCGIHDLLRDMCIREAREEKFFQVANRVHICVAEGFSLRRISIHPNTEILPSEAKIVPTSLVKSILSFDRDLPHSFIVSLNFRQIRVLHMLNVHFFHFPANIVELVNLRYLACVLGADWLLSSISRLQNLQSLFLYVQGDSIYLPLWRMPLLRHIWLTAVNLPDLAITEGGNSYVLENLQTLSKVRNFRCSEEVVKRILNLKKLGIFYDDVRENWPDYCLSNLVNLHKLETLKCSSYWPYPSFLQNLTFPPSLRKLTLNGWGLPWEAMTIIGVLPNLEVLKLKWKHAFYGKEWKPTEGEFSRLKFLLLECLELEDWIVDYTHFQRLERLVIKSCKYLKEIPCSIGEIPTLQIIEMDDSSPSAVTSAKQILEDQQELGNDVLRLHIRYSLGS